MRSRVTSTDMTVLGRMIRRISYPFSPTEGGRKNIALFIALVTTLSVLGSVYFAERAAGQSMPSKENPAKNDEILEVLSNEKSPTATDPSLMMGTINCNSEPGIIIHDNGTIGGGYISAAEGGAYTIASKFTPATYPALAKSACIAFYRAASSPTSTMSFQLVIHDDDGAGGSPGTQLGSVSATATGIPVGSGSTVWQSVDISSLNLNVTSGSVYIGGRYTYLQNDTKFIGFNTSPPVASNAGGGYRRSGNGTWSSMVSTLNYGADFIRASFESVAPPTGTSTTLTSSPDPSTSGQAVTFTASVTLSGSPVTSGGVTFIEGGSCAAPASTLGSANLNGSGQAAISYSALSVGSHTITACYGGASGFDPSSGNDTHLVDQPSQSGQTIDFPPLGNKNFGDPDFGISATASSGLPVSFTSLTLAQCTVAGSTVHIVTGGICTIRASQGGDANWEPAPNVDRSFSIGRATANCSVSGYNVTYNGAPHSATGSCTGVGGVALAGLDLSATVHTNAGNYPSDPWTFTDSTGNYENQSGTVASVINKAVTIATINSDGPDPSVYGQNYTVNATLAVASPGAGSPTGSIAVSDGDGNSCTITLPAASCTLPSTAPGNKTISATYAGDGNFFGSSDTEPHFVDKASTATTINSDDPDPSVYGQPYTVNATVAVLAPGAGTPTGSIAVSDGFANSCTIILPATSCVLPSTLVGPKTLTATYAGDANFYGSSDTESHQVIKADTTTVVTSSLNPSVFGQTVTFTATVAAAPPGAGTPTGTVSFNIDGNLYCVNTPLNAARQATCTLSGLPALAAGLRNVVALYDGDMNFNPSAGTVNQTVNRAATTTTITNDAPDPSLVNQPYNVTWTVAVTAPGAGTPTGTVTINGGSGGGMCSAPAAASTCSLTPTTVGTKTIVATFAGDANFNGSTSPGVSHNVNLEITGNIRQMPANVPLAGTQVVLAGTNGTTATTDANGNYRFAGFFTGNYTVTPNVATPAPGRVYDAIRRVYNDVTNNIANADFLAYNSINDAPRKLTLPITHVKPGSLVSMPVVMESQGNEASVSFSFTYDINPLAQPPTVICGSNAPDCVMNTDSSTLGRVGVTLTPGPNGFTNNDAAGTNEIAKINFQTVATTLSNSPVTFADSPVTRSTSDSSGNSLLTHYVDGWLVFSQGIEGDLACAGPCKTGDNFLLSNDVVKARLFATGIQTPDPIFNEYQRADTAPASSNGDGRLDATDVVQTRRYAAGLDLPRAAGGPGIPGGAPAPRQTSEKEFVRDVQLGSIDAVAGSVVTLPIDAVTGGDEVAMSFTLRYDPKQLGDPRVELGSSAPMDAVITANTKEPGVLVVVIDAATAFEASKNARLLNVTFDVLKTARDGDTLIEFEDGVISDAAARPLASLFTTGKINVTGLVNLDSEVLPADVSAGRQKSDPTSFLTRLIRSHLVDILFPISSESIAVK